MALELARQKWVEERDVIITSVVRACVGSCSSLSFMLYDTDDRGTIIGGELELPDSDTSYVRLGPQVWKVELTVVFEYRGNTNVKVVGVLVGDTWIRDDDKIRIHFTGFQGYRQP